MRGWPETVPGSLSASDWKDSPRFGRPVIPPDDELSDPVRVRIASRDQIEPDSRSSGEQRILPVVDDLGVAGQKNDDGVPDGVSDAISHPVSEKERGKP